jgi:hypothetical protein
MLDWLLKDALACRDDSRGSCDALAVTDLSSHSGLLESLAAAAGTGRVRGFARAATGHHDSTLA